MCVNSCVISHTHVRTHDEYTIRKESYCSACVRPDSAPPCLSRSSGRRPAAGVRVYCFRRKEREREEKTRPSTVNPSIALCKSKVSYAGGAGGGGGVDQREEEREENS